MKIGKSIYLKIDEWEKLRQEADERKKSVSAYVESIIEERDDSAMETIHRQISAIRKITEMKCDRKTHEDLSALLKSMQSEIYRL